jgi:protein TonB
MFEQSIVDTRGPSKPWALAAMTGQLALVGLALTIPLLYPEVLNAPRMLIAIVYRTSDPPPTDMPMAKSSNAPRSGGPSLPARHKPFVAPQSIPSSVAVIIDPLGASIASTIRGGGTGMDVGPGIPFGTGIAFPTAAPPAPVKPATQVVKEPPLPVQVRRGGTVQEALIINRVIPVYPPLAKAARIQGLVRLEGIIARDGTIQQLRVIGGHPLLVQSALDAVRQWRYKPTLLNGDPVEVIAPIDVNFKLSN